MIALQGNDVDAIAQFVPSGAEAILNNPSYVIIRLKASNHRELSMRTDQAPWNDARVRQAMALSLNRPGMVQALLHGLGSVANDNPFAPMFRSTNTSVLPSACGTSPRRSNCCPPRAIRTGSTPRCTRTSTRRSASSPR